MSKHHRVNYLEFQVKDIATSKQFFGELFGWGFVDYGPDYCAITDAGIDAGFYQSDQVMSAQNGSALIVIFSDKLEQSEQAVREHGGNICKPIFSFPGGRRFHFLDPSGNEFAVWGE